MSTTTITSSTLSRQHKLRSSAVSHPIRAAIIAAVRSSKSKLTLPEIAQRTGIDIDDVRLHKNVLERARVI